MCWESVDYNGTDCTQRLSEIGDPCRFQDTIKICHSDDIDAAQVSDCRVPTDSKTPKPTFLVSTRVKIGI